MVAWEAIGVVIAGTTLVGGATGWLLTTIIDKRALAVAQAEDLKAKKEIQVIIRAELAEFRASLGKDLAEDYRSVPECVLMNGQLVKQVDEIRAEQKSMVERVFHKLGQIADRAQVLIGRESLQE